MACLYARDGECQGPPLARGPEGVDLCLRHRYGPDPDRVRRDVESLANLAAHGNPGIEQQLIDAGWRPGVDNGSAMLAGALRDHVERSGAVVPESVVVRSMGPEDPEHDVDRRQAILAALAIGRPNGGE